MRYFDLKYTLLAIVIAVGLSSCIAPTGSYSPGTTQYGHFEGPNTGQVILSSQPAQESGVLAANYALSKNFFVQGQASISAYDTKIKNHGPGSNGQFLAGYYLWRDGYQCLTFGVGGGGGVANVVNSNETFARLNFYNLQVQMGISENYGPTRMALGLNYKSLDLIGGRIYLSGNGSVLGNVEKLKNAGNTHFLSGHFGLSWRLKGSLRFATSYDLTFMGTDYSLLDKDALSLGLVYDLGKMSRPSKPPKRDKKSRRGPKKKVYDVQGE